MPRQEKTLGVLNGAFISNSRRVGGRKSGFGGERVFDVLAIRGVQRVHRDCKENYSVGSCDKRTLRNASGSDRPYSLPAIGF